MTSYSKAVAGVRNNFIQKRYLLSQVALMRRSKMEMYISTLEALSHYGPLILTRVTYKTNMNCSQIKGVLADLIQKKLVEKRESRKSRVVYAATPAARKVLSQFEELKEMLPIEETNNHLF